MNTIKPNTHAMPLAKASAASLKPSPSDAAHAVKSEATSQQPGVKVTLSKEGKELLAYLQHIEQNAKGQESNKNLGDKVESFTYGALGMASPETLKKEGDDSYSAGQYVSAAATIASLLLLL